ncbi:selenium cofactor biosynthesis protein YqeC [Natrinema halophilum]|uniref:Selenium-dependent hydroxylase accessory protein YqeC n=1 Tax=Natrinema halophilum TaxID=1699371 RepID=A0A7D5GF89_9EURY|nr:selenium cofactor biosynthesis protein YqeC [Natrinema halophilum]QLG47447.1 putative selenium-dependent hydroxylase accessory protein YqeC [Natrinema halophilum]
MDVIEALRAETGVVAVVGAGGKKTTLYALAEKAAREEDRRVVVTATVRIPPFDRNVTRVHVTADPIPAIKRTSDWPVGVVPGRDGEERYGGYDPGDVDRIASAEVADLVLVKADGARTREFKAPGTDEPQLPRRVDTVIPIASVRAVGKPLSSEYVHRPEHVSAITGRKRGDPVQAIDVARVLASERGGLTDVPDDATVVPLLNKVDDEDSRSDAEEIAAGLLERTPAVERVVLARMVADDPVVDVIEA